jgi:alkanesulfonate monooxygenase SsuD/methylene tetrahydromethanopterin reductase-like flavin-dependent oxidoreductase (luciferase family)
MALAATDLARRAEAAGFSGMLFTEGHQVPRTNITTAALALPRRRGAHVAPALSEVEGRGGVISHSPAAAYDPSGPAGHLPTSWGGNDSGAHVTDLY